MSFAAEQKFVERETIHPSIRQLTRWSHRARKLDSSIPPSIHSTAGRLAGMTTAATTARLKKNENKWRERK